MASDDEDEDQQQAGETIAHEIFGGDDDDDDASVIQHDTGTAVTAAAETEFDLEQSEDESGLITDDMISGTHRCSYPV